MIDWFFSYDNLFRWLFSICSPEDAIKYAWLFLLSAASIWNLVGMGRDLRQNLRLWLLLCLICRCRKCLSDWTIHWVVRLAELIFAVVVYSKEVFVTWLHKQILVPFRLCFGHIIRSCRQSGHCLLQRLDIVCVLGRQLGYHVSEIHESSWSYQGTVCSTWNDRMLFLRARQYYAGSTSFQLIRYRREH